jgi:hypothetical protein
MLELFEAVRADFWAVREENYGKKEGGARCSRILGSRVGDTM